MRISVPTNVEVPRETVVPERSTSVVSLTRNLTSEPEDALGDAVPLSELRTAADAQVSSARFLQDAVLGVENRVPPLSQDVPSYQLSLETQPLNGCVVFKDGELFAATPKSLMRATKDGGLETLLTARDLEAKFPEGPIYESARISSAPMPLADGWVAVVADKGYGAMVFAVKPGEAPRNLGGLLKRQGASVTPTARGTLWIASREGLKEVSVDGESRELNRHTFSWPSKVAFAKDGSAYVKTLDPHGPSSIHRISADGKTVSGNISPVGQFQPLADANGNVVFLGNPPQSSEQQLHLVGPDGSTKLLWQDPEVIGAPTFDPNGEISFGTRDGKVHIASPDGSLQSLQVGNSLIHTFRTADGQLHGLAEDGTGYAISPGQGTSHPEIDFHQTVGDPVLGPDGQVYTGSAQQHIFELAGPGNQMWTASDQPSGTFLATYSPDRATPNAPSNAWRLTDPPNAIPNTRFVRQRGFKEFYGMYATLYAAAHASGNLYSATGEVDAHLGLSIPSNGQCISVPSGSPTDRTFQPSELKAFAVVPATVGGLSGTVDAGDGFVRVELPFLGYQKGQARFGLHATLEDPRQALVEKGAGYGIESPTGVTWLQKPTQNTSLVAAPKAPAGQAAEEAFWPVAGSREAVLPGAH